MWQRDRSEKVYKYPANELSECQRKFAVGDQSGRKVVVKLTKYDSAPYQLIESLTNTISRDNYEEEIAKHAQDGFDYDWGDPHIGDCSLYSTSTDQSTDIQTTLIVFVYNNNHVMVGVTDDESKSKKRSHKNCEIKNGDQK